MKRLLALFSFVALPVFAQDFVSDPKAFCRFLEKEGLNAQFAWGETQPGSGAYLCQYAGRPMGGSVQLPIGKAQLDVKSGALDLTLSVMGLGGMVRVEARDALAVHVETFYRLNGHTVPPRVQEILAGELPGEHAVGSYRVTYVGDPWANTRTVRLTFSSQLSDAALAAATEPAGAPQAAATQDVVAQLDQRCVKAIESSGQAAQPATWTRGSTPMGAYGHLFTYRQPDGEFVCTVCAPQVRGSACASLGLSLSFGQPGQAHRELPAELDLKCIDALQSGLRRRGSVHVVDHGHAARVVVTPQHTDTRWVFALAVDGADYRCVIRRQDGGYLLDRKVHGEWKSLASGRMP